MSLGERRELPVGVQNDFGAFWGARTALAAILVANFAFLLQGLRLEAEPSPTWMQT